MRYGAKNVRRGAKNVWHGAKNAWRGAKNVWHGAKNVLSTFQKKCLVLLKEEGLNTFQRTFYTQCMYV